MEQLEEFIPEEEENRRITMYELAKNAQAKNEANRMKQNRADYFEILYEDIRFYSVRLDPFRKGSGNPAVDYQALEIIDAKAAYDKRIIKLDERHSRWRGFLHNFNKQESDLLRRYFEDGDPIPYETIKRLLYKAGSMFESFEEARGKARDDETKEEFSEYRKQFPERFKTYSTPIQGDESKQRYLINGQFVSMTPDDYAKHLEKETSERNQLYERLGI